MNAKLEKLHQARMKAMDDWYDKSFSTGIHDAEAWAVVLESSAAYKEAALAVLREREAQANGSVAKR